MRRNFFPRGMNSASPRAEKPTVSHISRNRGPIYPRLAAHLLTKKIMPNCNIVSEWEQSWLIDRFPVHTYPKRVLYDGRRNHDLPRQRLVTVDGVTDGDGRDADHLDTYKHIAHDDNHLPRPGPLVPEGGHDHADEVDGGIGSQGGETHLGLEDAAVAARPAEGHPVGEGTGREERDGGTDHEGEVDQTDLVGVEEVRGCAEDLGLRQVEH